MVSYNYGLAKGLREPCSPYREAYYFGADLNEPSASGWNCLPAFVEQGQSYDLSSLSKGKEVVVDLLKLSNIPSGTLNFHVEWYRNRDNKRLFTYDWSYAGNVGGWTYFYSYLGYVDWEINENGGYRVEFTVSGAASYFKVIQLEITGIEEEIPEPPISTGFIGSIIQAFNDASEFCYSIYRETLSWIFPFWLIAPPFYSLSIIFNRLAWSFHDFSLWITEVTDKLPFGFDFSLIWTWIIEKVPNLSEINTWFDNWRGYVSNLLSEWWLTTKTTVQGWIDIVKDWAWLWIDYLSSRLDSLQASWDNFVTVILPTLPNWLSIDSLIKSWFTEYAPFWQGWQEVRNDVINFFSDPLQWLYDRLDKFFERFW